VGAAVTERSELTLAFPCQQKQPHRRCIQTVRETGAAPSPAGTRAQEHPGRGETSTPRHLAPPSLRTLSRDARSTHGQRHARPSPVCTPSRPLRLIPHSATASPATARRRAPQSASRHSAAASRSNAGSSRCAAWSAAQRRWARSAPPAALAPRRRVAPADGVTPAEPRTRPRLPEEDARRERPTRTRARAGTWPVASSRAHEKAPRWSHAKASMASTCPLNSLTWPGLRAAAPGGRASFRGAAPRRTRAGTRRHARAQPRRALVYRSWFGARAARRPLMPMPQGATTGLDAPRRPSEETP